MTLVLFLAWVVVFMISMNGSQAAGGMLYFIALTPYVVLAIFLVIGLITDGGLEGLSVLFQGESFRLVHFFR
jgi:solute carrier family 6 amino acid/orphan transporter-like 15/16/17/18/20